MTKKDAKINAYMRCVMMMVVFLWLPCGFYSCGDKTSPFMGKGKHIHRKYQTKPDCAHVYPLL